MTRNPWVEVALFVLVLVGLFAWAGEALTRAAGGAGETGPSAGVSLERGEALFWGAGKCHTCHAVGTRGRAVRGPNLGAAAGETEIGFRAVARARERSATLGRSISPTAYLVESLTDPGAHLVEGFTDEMPVIYEPPIALDPEELTSIVLYLQSLGAAPNLAEIRLPAAARATRRVAEEAWEPYLDGVPEAGRVLFFDPEGPAACGTCHRVDEDGGTVGPDLSGIAGIRSASFIVQAILEPSAAIANGYETTVVELRDGRLFDGIAQRDTDDSLALVTATGETITLATADIARRATQTVSLMPENLADLLSVTQLHDILAYLQTLR